MKGKDMVKLVIFNTPLGWMGLVGTSAGLKEVVLPEKSREEVLAQDKRRLHTVEDDDTCFNDLPHRLKVYLSGKTVDFSDELDLDGTTRFRQQVWRVTRAIPHGETRSYAWVSGQLGYGKKAARAVGQALGKNPLPIIIPCHRVLSSDGGLGGFSAGLPLKKHLLQLESAGR